MTCINALVRADRVHLVTDGSVYEPEGAVIGTMQKAYILAHVSAVIACRGPTYLPPALHAVLNGSSLSDFDDLLCKIVPATRSTIEHGLAFVDPARVADAASRLDLTRFDVVVVGWSHRRQRGEIYQLDTSRADWMLEAQGAGFIMPGENPDLVSRLQEHGWGLHDERRDEANLLELVRHQRAVDDLLPNGARFRTIGGFAQHTTITAESISTRVVERWH